MVQNVGVDALLRTYQAAQMFKYKKNLQNPHGKKWRVVFGQLRPRCQGSTMGGAGVTFNLICSASSWLLIMFSSMLQGAKGPEKNLAK
jgi:hypothetical protein